jgi:hypothetical protein
MEVSMHALRRALARFVQVGNWAAVALAISIFSGCAVTLVQPYDEKLVSDTEAIFKQASVLVDEGISKSPRTDEERAAIRPPSTSEAHYSKFEPSYAALLRDADVLILRSLTRSGEIDKVGNKLQQKIESLIESGIPSACPDLDQELKDLSASLTVRNYIDLKCFFVNWKAQHGDMQRTGQTQILKKANWEARKGALFNIVLAIQKAETFKKK